MMTPEELRREIYENILKRRIFQADRLEKIEKVLLGMELIPKDVNYCSDDKLHEFTTALNQDETLDKVYSMLL